MLTRQICHITSQITKETIALHVQKEDTHIKLLIRLLDETLEVPAGLSSL